MSEYIPSQEFENDIRAALNIQQASPEFVSKLRYQLVARTAKRSVSSRIHAWRIGRALGVSLGVLIALLVVVWVIGPQQVVAAVRSLRGYLPGVGLVENDDKLRILDEPVTVQRLEITLCVTQAASDWQKTVIVYQVDGLSLPAANSQGENVVTGSREFLRLPDGSTLEPTAGSGNGWAIGFQMRLEYPPLPPEVNEATLVVPILPSMPAGAAPENWEIPLTFVQAPDGAVLMPLPELSAPERPPATPIPSATGHPVEPSPTKAASSTPAGEYGIRLSLENVIDLGNNYLLQGSIVGDGSDDVAFVWNETLTLTDAHGNAIPIEAVPSDSDPRSESESGFSWEFQTTGKGYPGPWTLSVPSVVVNSSPQSTFVIDLGPDPQPGQTWDVTQELDIAGHRIVLTAFRLTQEQGDVWIEFTFQSGSDVLHIGVTDPDNQSERISGRGSRNGDGEITSAFTYDPLPTGEREMVVDRFSDQVDGPWQVSWQPPAGDEQNYPTITPRQSACLTGEKWEQLLDEHSTALPEGLHGQLLLQGYTGELLPTLSLVSLDGNQQQNIAAGAWPALSPDGSILAFSQDSGIHLADLNTGQIVPLGGTTELDQYPIWSPDGQWIAFMRLTDQTIHRVHPDGSELHAVAQRQDLAILSQWLPDGQTIVYEAFAQEGAVIRTLDLASGVVNDLVQTKNAKPSSNFAVAPAGDWIAYADRTYGQPTQDVFVFDVVNSEERLLVDLDDAILRVGGWNPEGEWLAITIDGSEPGPLPVLINPNTCDVVPLWNLRGEVVSWIAADD